jgi:hypothetical protein
LYNYTSCLIFSGSICLKSENSDYKILPFFLSPLSFSSPSASHVAENNVHFLVFPATSISLEYDTISYFLARLIIVSDMLSHFHNVLLKPFSSSELAC